MIHPLEAPTNPVLLGRLADWLDQTAWSEFVSTYSPCLLKWADRAGLDGPTADDLCQIVWLELAARMQSFQYDPRRSFRAWLKTLFRCRLLDFLKSNRHKNVFYLPDDFEPEVHEEPGSQEPLHSVRDELLSRSEAVQAAVRRRVSERTWDVFWRTAVLDQDARSTADELGMSIFAVFSAKVRVENMLQQEAARLGFPKA